MLLMGDKSKSFVHGFLIYVQPMVEVQTMEYVSIAISGCWPCLIAQLIGIPLKMFPELWMVLLYINC